MDAHGSARASVSIARIRLGKRIESESESNPNRIEGAFGEDDDADGGKRVRRRRVRRSHAFVERVEVERVVVVVV